MIAVRSVLGLLGLAALAWGAWLVYPRLSLEAGWMSLGVWLVAGPLIHDGLIAPVLGVVGLVVARVLPRSWRLPVVGAVVLSLLLSLISLPLLWRTHAPNDYPGLEQADYGPRLALTLGVVWAVALLFGLSRWLLHRRHALVRRHAQAAWHPQ